MTNPMIHTRNESRTRRFAAFGYLHRRPQTASTSDVGDCTGGIRLRVSGVVHHPGVLAVCSHECGVGVRVSIISVGERRGTATGHRSVDARSSDGASSDGPLRKYPLRCAAHGLGHTALLTTRTVCTGRTLCAAVRWRGGRVAASDHCGVGVEHRPTGGDR